LGSDDRCPRGSPLYPIGHRCIWHVFGTAGSSWARRSLSRSLAAGPDFALDRRSRGWCWHRQFLHAGSRVASRRPGIARPRGSSGAASLPTAGRGCQACPGEPRGSPQGRSAGCHTQSAHRAGLAAGVSHPRDLPTWRGDNGDVVDDLAGRDSCGVSSIWNSPTVWHRGQPSVNGHARRLALPLGCCVVVPRGGPAGCHPLPISPCSSSSCAWLSGQLPQRRGRGFPERGGDV
jgi:hypothetical protein